MRATCIALVGALAFAIAPTGCATVIGLDSGHPPSDDGGDPEGDSASASADASSTADPLVCAPDTADCNGDPKDGCEASLTTPQHCGSCTNVCGPGHDCSAGTCCLAINQPCSRDEDCCTAKCESNKCSKPG